MWIRRSATAVLAALALLLAGCGASGSDGQVNLTWWVVSQTDAATAAMDDMIADFEEANPGVTVTVEQRAIDAHKEALRTSVGTSAGADVYFMWAGLGLGGEFVDAGASVDLTPYYEQYRWADRFNAATMGNFTQYGGHHGVPWTQHYEAIYYHESAFAQAGITTPPATYDELVAAAEKLKAGGVSAFAFGGTVNWHVMRLLDSLLETECGAATADRLTALAADWGTTPCVTAAFTEFEKWTGDYVHSGFLGIDDSQAQQLFYSGTAAMALEGDWFISSLIENGVNLDDIGVMAIPTGTGRVYGFAEGMYISPGSEHPDVAAKFLDHITSTEQQQKHLGVWSPISVNSAVQASGAGTPLDPQWEAVIAGAKGGYVNNDQTLPLKITTEYWRIQNSVITGDIAPAEAGAALQTFIASNA